MTRAVRFAFLAACAACSALLALRALAESAEVDRPLAAVAAAAGGTRPSPRSVAPFTPAPHPAPPPEQAATPQPNQKLTYRVHGGDTWERIARRHGTTVEQLRRWNPERPQMFSIGDELSVRVPEDFEIQPETGFGLDRSTLGLPLLPVPEGGESRGRPSRGRLAHGVQLPENPALYLVRRPEFAYGSSHAVRYLQLALAKFRASSDYAGPLVVSDMSQRRGRSYGPHSSHRSGRDVDLWLPLRKELLQERGAWPLADGPIDYGLLASDRASDIDWEASLDLIKALVRTGEVQFIFLSRPRQRLLYRVARAQGLSKETLRDVIQYPWHSGNAIVRHVPHHHRHMHVRFRCASSETRCF